MTTQIDDMTPVIIGVGQFQMDVPTSLENAEGPIEVTARAIEAAIKDTGITDLRSKIDRLTTIRTFGDSGPVFPCPFGASKNMPLSIANRAGLEPNHLVYTKLGGEQPQVQVAETAQALQKGESEFAVICGGEAIATMKAAMRQGVTLDWSDSPETHRVIITSDEGFDFSDLPIAPEEMRHGLINAIMVYSMMETARRLRLGLSVESYQKTIGGLFSPFSKIASHNPFSMFKQVQSSEKISGEGDKNPMLASPYTKAMVAKDSVNQSAAIIMTTVKKAKSLGISESQWVFLNGYAKGEEPLVCERPNIDRFEILETVLGNALKSANITQRDITAADFYSCFPIVVFSATELLPKTQVDTYTLTGGLPFFGGPGNNYSMHAIAEIVTTIRHEGGYGLIHANGGVMTKHAVGVYSSNASIFTEISITHEAKTKRVDSSPDGIGYMVSFCLNYSKNKPSNAIILLSMESGDHALARFEGDLSRLETLKSKQPFNVRTEKHFNIAELI